MKRPLRLITKHCTFANVAATLAVFMAVTGTSYAAKQLGPKQIKRNSVTGADFKSSTITAADFSLAAKLWFRGPTGDPGSAGSKGDRGDRGPKGPDGDPGRAANARASYSSYDSKWMTFDPDGNPGAADWYGYGLDGDNLVDGLIGNTRALGTNASTMMDLSTQPANGASGHGRGPLQAPWLVNVLTVTANATLVYRTDAEDGDASVHTRAKCWLEMNRGIADSTTYDQIGPAMWVSGYTERKVATVTMTGNINKSADTYQARIRCQDADATAGVTRWRFVRGNLSVLATERTVA